MSRLQRLISIPLILALILSLGVVIAPPEATAGDPVKTDCVTCGDGDGSGSLHPFPIMRFDRETLNEFVAAYNSAPTAYIDPGLAPGHPAPGGSQDLLGRLNYIPAERNQGSCGNCWAWAGTGVLEIALDVQETIYDRLSVQYMTSCQTGVIGKACCDGGWLADVADFYDPSGGTGKCIPWSNTNAHYQSGDGSCGPACGSISTYPNYGIDSCTAVTVPTQGEGQSTAIANIKNVLDQNKAVFFAFFLATGADWTDFFNFWLYQSEDVLWDPDPYCGHTWDPDDGGGHAVLCVGYNDDDPDPANHYWVMLNSWGTAGGGRPNGLFRMKMDINYDCWFYDDPYSYWSLYWQTLDVTFDMTPPLDHFKFYWVEEGPYVGDTVLLEDQFGALEAEVQQAYFFGNPVQKEHDGVVTPIADPDHHLTLYELGYEAPYREWYVEVNNQFGYQALTVSGPVALAVPTQKASHAPPEGLDHFLLWEVPDALYIMATIDLADQFGVDLGVVVLQPVALGNPVHKTHGEIVTEIVNPDEHLVFYHILSENPFYTSVEATNQFGMETFFLGDALILAVPSEKVYWEEIPREAVLESAVYAGTGYKFGSHVGDTLTLTFSDDIVHASLVEVHFAVANWLYEGWSSVDCAVSGNELVVTAVGVFGTPRDIVGDRVMTVTGVEDVLGDPVIVPDGGVEVEGPEPTVLVSALFEGEGEMFGSHVGDTLTLTFSDDIVHHSLVEVTFGVANRLYEGWSVVDCAVGGKELVVTATGVFGTPRDIVGDYVMTVTGLRDGLGNPVVIPTGGVEVTTGVVLEVGEGKEFATIQAAVDAAEDGYAIHVYDGTYVEQVSIIDKSITVLGMTNAKPVIQAPAAASRTTLSIPESGRTFDPIVFISGTTGPIAVTVDGFEIDGNDDPGSDTFVGILARNVAPGVISNNDLHSLMGTQETLGISVYGEDSEVIISDNTITGFSRNAMAVIGASTADVSGNTILGRGYVGEGYWAQNGIQLYQVAAGTATGNTLSDIGWIWPGHGTRWSSTGILIWECYGTTLVEDNELTNVQIAIRFSSSSFEAIGNTIDMVDSDGLSGTGGIWGNPHGHPDAVASPFDAGSLPGAGAPGSPSSTLTWHFEDNTLTGDLASGGYGIAILPYTGFEVEATAVGNVVENWYIGVMVYDYGYGDTFAANINYNCIEGNTYGLWNYTTTTVDATDNWWGSASGPTHGGNTFNVGYQGDAVSDYALYVPWLDDECTVGESFAPVWLDATYPFSSIQAAIDAATGSTVTCVAGTYLEQVSIIDKNLTLLGDDGAVIQAPAAASRTTLSIPESTRTFDPIVFIDGATAAIAVTVDGFEIDGNDDPGTDNFVGILARNVVPGVISNNDLHSLMGTQETLGISVYGTATEVTIVGNTVTGFSRNGITVIDAAAADVEGNTIVGRGYIYPGWAQNGIQFWGVASGTVTGNTLSDMGWIWPEEGTSWSATGILIWECYGTTLVEDNELTDVQVAIRFVSSSFAALGNTVLMAFSGPLDYTGGIWGNPSGRPGSPASPFEYLAPAGAVAPASPSSLTFLFEDNTVTGDWALDGWGVAIWPYTGFEVVATATGNVVTNWDIGFDIWGSDPFVANINYNDIEGNNVGMWNWTTTVVDATNNWWGYDSGPYHPDTNPDGEGNPVSDNVDFDPWQTTPQPTEAVLESVVYAGTGTRFGSHVGDTLTLTFSSPIVHDPLIEVRFGAASWLYEGWTVMDWDVTGNQLLITVTSVFGTPRDLIGDSVMTVTGLVDGVGNPVVIPEGGVEVGVPESPDPAVLESAIYCGTGVLFGSHVGDTLTITFSNPIVHDSLVEVTFAAANRLYEGWTVMDWDISGNALLITVTSVFTTPRDLIGDSVMTVTGLNDGHGFSAVVPDGGVVIGSCP